MRASRDTGALGLSADVVIPTLALGAVDGGHEEPWLLLFPGLTHVVSPRQQTVTSCILAWYRRAESHPCPIVLAATPVDRQDVEMTRTAGH